MYSRHVHVATYDTVCISSCLSQTYGWLRTVHFFAWELLYLHGSIPYARQSNFSISVWYNMLVYIQYLEHPHQIQIWLLCYSNDDHHYACLRHTALWHDFMHVHIQWPIMFTRVCKCPLVLHMIIVVAGKLALLWQFTSLLPCPCWHTRTYMAYIGSRR